MNKQQIDVHSWVLLLADAGLDEAGRHRWHALFEERHSHAHQELLAWLGMEEPKIDEVRSHARTTWRS